MHYFSESLGKVSSLSRQYSRFLETLLGDFFDVDCDVGLVVDVYARCCSAERCGRSRRLVPWEHGRSSRSDVTLGVYFTKKVYSVVGCHEDVPKSS
jgi:hypothetical protein